MDSPDLRKLKRLLLGLSLPKRVADGMIELVIAVSEAPVFVAERERRASRVEMTSAVRRVAAEKRWGLPIFPPIPSGDGSTGDANSTVLHGEAECKTMQDAPISTEPAMQNDANSICKTMQNASEVGGDTLKGIPVGNPRRKTKSSTPVPVEEPPKPKPKKEPSPAQKAVWSLWSTYREAMQRVHSIDVGAKPDPTIKNALRALDGKTSDEVRDLINRFAEDRDTFLVANGWSIRFLPSRLQAYLVAKVRDERRPKESFASVSALTPEMASARRIDASSPEWVREIASAIEFGDKVPLYLTEAVAEWREGQNIAEPPAWRERLKPETSEEENA